MRNCMFFYLDVSWDCDVPESQVEHQVILLISILQRRAFHQCFRHCHRYLCTVPETSTVCVIYSNVDWEQGFQSPRKKSSSFHCVFITPVLISVFQTCYQLVFCVLLIQLIIFVKPTWMWREIMVFRVPGGISHWKVLYLALYRAYSILQYFSLYPACEVSTVFIVVEST